MIQFEFMKSKPPACTEDLMCAGGMLDLVRGSIVCENENQVVRVYHNACNLSAEKNDVEVVRIKNGFKKPAAGGYCDLKLFILVVSKSDDDQKMCHICELQVHLASF